MGDTVQSALNYIGRPDPLRGMKFQITVPSLPLFGQMAFSKVSGMSQESELIEYREGDEVLSQRKMPGLIKTGEVTLERGIAHTPTMEALVAWKESASTAGTGLADGVLNYKNDMYIQVANRLGTIEWEIALLRAWPRVIEYGDLDANASDIWIARVGIVYEAIIPNGVPAPYLAVFQVG